MTEKNDNKRMEVLAFIRYYLPGYKAGGPLRTLSNMVDVLSDKDIHFKIVTSDRDVMDENPYSNVVIGKWNKVGKSEVFYCSRKQQGFWYFREIMNRTSYDVLYLQSFFDPVFTLKPLILRFLNLICRKPVLLAPRGEFSAGALSIKKLKKKIFLRMSKILYGNVYFQASSPDESAEIEGIFKNSKRIIIAPDLPEIPKDHIKNYWVQKGKNALKIIFLSRLSPMKNLDYAIDVILNVKCPVVFHIYGPMTDVKYWDSCKKKLDSLPAFADAKYFGPLSHNDVLKTMARYDLFFLPTRGENFGHVIFEALSVGLPVLISDRTIWRGLDRVNAGWDIPLADKSKFISTIEECFHMASEEFYGLRQSAFLYAKAFIFNSNLIDKNMEVFTMIDS